MFSKINATLIALSFLLLAATCHNQDNAVDTCKDVICTMQFATVTVQVKDAGGNPVVLDSARTYNKKGASISNSTLTGTGQYTIIDDSYQKALALRTEDVAFIGYKNGKKVFSQSYKISADCCHVKKESGPEVITIR